MGLGDIARAQQDHGAARSSYEQARALNAEVGDRQRVARCLVGLGWTALDRGDDAEAQPWFAESLTIFTRLGDRAGVAGALEGHGQAGGEATQV